MDGYFYDFKCDFIQQKKSVFGHAWTPAYIIHRCVWFGFLSLHSIFELILNYINQNVFLEKLIIHHSMLKMVCNGFQNVFNWTQLIVFNFDRFFWKLRSYGSRWLILTLLQTNFWLLCNQTRLSMTILFFYRKYFLPNCYDFICSLDIFHLSFCIFHYTNSASRINCNLVDDKCKILVRKRRKNKNKSPSQVIFQRIQWL